jgi:hypothetical protein
VLPYGNFLWPEADPTDPRHVNGYSEQWPYFDYILPRFCDEGGNFKTRYPSASDDINATIHCRNQQQFPGWSGIVTLNPGLSTFNNTYKFETRYNISNASTLPPGALPGYAFNLTVELTYTDYNFSHHPMQLN